MTFNPNAFQRLKYNLVYEEGKKRIIELKSRKFGTTTGWCIDWLDEVAFGKRYYQSVTVNHSTDKSSEIFQDLVKFTWRNIKELCNDSPPHFGPSPVARRWCFTSS